MTAKIIAATAAARALPARTAAALSLRLGFVYIQFPSTQFLAIEGCDSFFGFAGIRHLDESESTRTSGITISDYADLLDSAVGGKQCPQLCFSCTVRDVANEQFLHFVSFSSNQCYPDLNRRACLNVASQHPSTTSWDASSPLAPGPDADHSKFAPRQSARTLPESPSAAAKPRKHSRTGLRLSAPKRRVHYFCRPPGP